MMMEEDNGKPPMLRHVIQDVCYSMSYLHAVSHYCIFPTLVKTFFQIFRLNETTGNPTENLKKIKIKKRHLLIMLCR